MSNPISEIAAMYFGLWLIGILISTFATSDEFFAIPWAILKIALPDPNQELIFTIIKYIFYTLGYAKFRLKLL